MTNAHTENLSLLERFSAVLDSGRQIASALSKQSVFSAVRDAALTLMSGERCLILEACISPRPSAVAGRKRASAAYESGKRR